MSMKEQKHWASKREYGSSLGLRLLAVCYRFGGKLLLKPLLYLVVFYFFITRPATRQYSQYYLTRALKHKASYWQLFKHQLAFANALADRIAAWMGKVKRSDVAFSGHQTLVALQKKQQGAIILGAHIGNLDMCRAIVAGDSSVVMNVILHTKNSKKFNALVNTFAVDSSVRLLEVDDMNPAVAMQLNDMLRRGEYLVLLADRMPTHNQQRVLERKLLGDSAQFPEGPFWLSILLAAPVFFMTSVRTQHGYYTLLERLSEGGVVPRKDRAAAVGKLLDAYLLQLEALCIRYPYQWFNFYDFWQDATTAKLPCDTCGDLRYAPASNNKQ